LPAAGEAAPGSPRRRKAPQKATTTRNSEITTFQPAKDRNSSRHWTSVQETTLMVSSSARMSVAPLTSPPEAPQSVGPGQKPHSAPAW